MNFYVIFEQSDLDLEDLKTVIDFIDLLLMNQRQIYILNMKQIKVRLSHRFRLFIFTHLFARVISFVLKQIYNQYRLIIAAFTALFVCTRMFTTITELLYAHKIQKRMFERDKLIQLKDVYFH